jgi:hypothetical protein
MTRKDNINYKLGRNNELLILRDAKAVKPKGNFILAKNSLLYRFDDLKSWRQTLNLPSRKEFVGSWRLDSNHDLEFVLRDSQTAQEGSVLKFKGEIIAVEADRLVFTFSSKKEDNVYKTQLIKLSGRWCSDKYNRLIFNVKRKTEDEDLIIFDGTWELNDNQRIIYRYEKEDLLRRTKIEKTLAFNGFWDMAGRNRLSYLLEKTENSVFSFKVQLENPPIIAREGAIKYRLGIGASGSRASDIKSIVLFGAWRVSKKSEITLEMEYEKSVFRSIVFLSSYYMTGKDKIMIRLKTKAGEDLDMGLVFERRFLSDERAVFLGFKKRGSEKMIEAGIRLPW